MCEIHNKSNNNKNLGSTHPCYYWRKHGKKREIDQMYDNFDLEAG